MPELQIDYLAKEDVYKDLVRVPEAHRLNADSQPIPEGTLCLVCVGSRSARLFLRGNQAETSPVVLMDERTRNVLGVNVGQVVDLQVSPLGWWGQLLWAWNASEPAYRIAARLAVLSVLISVVGLVLGVLPFFSKG